ncbi:hypothetical protein RIF29_15042 [Crotalaria pallida]|uniref:Uncharacterized protein n=1 Tax=Crotalaria pallida TaxID=3830 RepID=A0AAN9FJC2_CROPI
MAVFDCTMTLPNMGMLQWTFWPERISNAYLRSVVGRSAKILFEFVKEMPKHETSPSIKVASLIYTLFYTWVIRNFFLIWNWGEVELILHYAFTNHKGSN